MYWMYVNFRNAYDNWYLYFYRHILFGFITNFDDKKYITYISVNSNREAITSTFRSIMCKLIR